jgi:hypothetical protein
MKFSSLGFFRESVSQRPLALRIPFWTAGVISTSDKLIASVIDTGE